MQLAHLTWSSSKHYSIWRIVWYNRFIYWSTHKTRHLLFIQYIYKIGILIHFKNTFSANNYVLLFKYTYFGIHWIIEINPIESSLNIYQRLTSNSIFLISSHCRFILLLSDRPNDQHFPKHFNIKHYRRSNCFLIVPLEVLVLCFVSILWNVFPDKGTGCP